MLLSILRVRFTDNAGAVAVAKHRHSEDDIQAAVCQHLRLRATSDFMWFHVPNGGRRNPREAARLKRMGVRPGVADFIILAFGRKPLALELKAKGGRISPAQHQFFDDWKRNGGEGWICTGLDHALQVLTAWGLIK